MSIKISPSDIIRYVGCLTAKGRYYIENKKSWLRFEDSHEKTVTYSLTRGAYINHKPSSNYRIFFHWVKKSPTFLPRKKRAENGFIQANE